MNTAKVIQLNSVRKQQAKAKPSKRSKTFRKYDSLLRGKRPLEKNEIMGLCWALNGVKNVNLSDTDRLELIQLLNARPERSITAEQTKFGIEWLRNRMFKRNGETRLRCPLSERQAEIVRNFKRFAWIGIYNSQSHYGNYGYNSPYKSYVPVWRVYDKAGNHFDYTVIAGGPGGSVDVVINPL